MTSSCFLITSKFQVTFSILTMSIEFTANIKCERWRPCRYCSTQPWPKLPDILLLYTLAFQSYGCARGTAHSNKCDRKAPRVTVLALVYMYIIYCSLGTTHCENPWPWTKRTLFSFKIEYDLFGFKVNPSDTLILHGKETCLNI